MRKVYTFIRNLALSYFLIIMLFCNVSSPFRYTAFGRVAHLRNRLNSQKMMAVSYVPAKRVRIEPPTEYSNPVFTNQRPFNDLCKTPILLEALQAKGISTATDIQALSYEQIYNGTDVLIGAETGSGKTLAYLLPLIDRFLHEQVKAHDNHKQQLPAMQGVILAPTNSLCDQIIEMSLFVQDYLMQNNITVRIGSNPNMINDFNLANTNSWNAIVCTPRSLVDQIKNIDPKLSDNPLRYLQFLVLDEADMLLDGSYLLDMEKIMEKLKLTRRQMIYEGLLKPHQKNIQHLLAAATISTHGTKSIASQVKQLFPLATNIRSTNMHCHHPSIYQEFIKVPSTEDTDEMVKLTKDELLSIEQQKSYASTAEKHGTMIFLNTAERAQKFAQSWRNAGLECAEVHGLQNRKTRFDNLRLFKEQSVPFLICTDACARGLDFPHVRAVVQVDFALNIVQHLHRIGRASRAGAQGFAINFYGDASNDLVTNVISENHQDSSGIEKSFSRRRGFRQKLKRGKIPSFENRNEHN